MNRYERNGYERGRRDAQAGASLDETPPLKFGTVEVEHVHSDSYIKAWLKGWSDEMGFPTSDHRPEEAAA